MCVVVCADSSMNVTACCGDVGDLWLMLQSGSVALPM
jgi:hypothetical protein